MLQIFSSNLLAITLSRLLAAVIRWSHILSSSLRSSTLWAHWDCAKNNRHLLLFDPFQGSGTCEALQAVSTRLWPSLFFFFFFSIKYVLDYHKKMTNNFQIFLNISLAARVEIVMKFGRYRFFWNLHHKFLDGKENFWNYIHHIQSFILGSTTTIRKEN